MRNILLACGAVAPVIYVGLIAGAQQLFPGYDHATQFISELGGPGAPRPEVFNYGIMLAGALTVLAGAGFALAAVARRGNAILAALAGLAVAVFGGSLIVGGVFPLPDERHLAWGAGFAVQIAPLLLLAALWKAPGLGGLKAFLGFSFVAVNAALALMFGVGDLIDQTNIGLFQRLYAATMFPWIGVAAACLLAAPRSQAGAFARAV